MIGCEWILCLKWCWMVCVDNAGGNLVWAGKWSNMWTTYRDQIDGQSMPLLLSWNLQWIWHKNQGFYYDTRGRIKSWNFRSAPSIIIVHILKNQVNSYDSNGVIAVPISTQGDEKWNLLFFCLPIFPQNPQNILGHNIRRWEDAFKENTTLLESWETVQNWQRNSGISFMNLNLRGEWSLDP